MPAEQSAVQKILGDFAPKLLDLTEHTVFDDIWERPELSKRDRSLITVTALVSLYRTDQLPFHLGLALQNGLTKDELVEAITHLAFYAGWPNAMSAITALRKIVEEAEGGPGATSGSGSAGGQGAGPAEE